MRMLPWYNVNHEQSPWRADHVYSWSGHPPRLVSLVGPSIIVAVVVIVLILVVEQRVDGGRALAYGSALVGGTSGANAGRSAGLDFLVPDDDPAAIVVLDHHLSGQDFLGDHLPLPLGRDHLRADRGEFPLEVAV